MRTIIITTITLALTACGTSNDIDVSGGTKNTAEATVSVEYVAEQCDDERFTAGQKLRCIELLTSPSVKAEVLADNLTEGQIDSILEGLD